MGERWSTETEELVAWTWYKSETPEHELPEGITTTGQRYRQHARDVLAALADAGLLVPPGGQVWVNAPDDGDTESW